MENNSGSAPQTGVARKASARFMPSRKCACKRPGKSSEKSADSDGSRKLRILGREDALLDQETVGRADGQLEILVADVEVEKAVIRLLEIDQIARISPEAHLPAEAIHFVEWGDAVRLAVKHQHRRQFATDQLGRADLFGGFEVGKPVERLALDRRVDERTEKQERLGAAVQAIDRRHLLRLGHGGQEGEQSPAGGTADREFVGIEIESIRIVAEPADQVAGVIDGLHRPGAVPCKRAGFRRHGNGTPAGKMQAVWHKLRGSRRIPEAPMEKHHHRARGVAGLLGKENVRLHRSLGAFLVNIGRRILENLSITRLADGRHSLQNTTHAGELADGIVRRRAAICLL